MMYISTPKSLWLEVSPYLILTERSATRRGCFIHVICDALLGAANLGDLAFTIKRSEVQRHRQQNIAQRSS